MADTTTIRTATCVEDLQTYPNTVFRIIRNITKSAGINEVKVADNVTLIFDGGFISGDFKLVGNKTSIQAPIAQIFDGVTVEGDWICDRTYPQWFDRKAGNFQYISELTDLITDLTKKKEDGDTEAAQKLSELPHDCSAAINAAIAMKQVGEVFLPKGLYYVASPIVMNYGIQLVGDGEGRIHEPAGNDNDPNKRASKIIPFLKTVSSDNAETFIDGFGSRAVVEINAKHGEGDTVTWEFHYPHPTSTIRNIVFHNGYVKKALTDNNFFIDNRVIINSKVCCLVAGGFLFENSSWQGFRQAIKVTKDYADVRTLRHCLISTTLYDLDKSPATSKDKMYMADLGKSGEALVVDNCAFHTERKVSGISDGSLRIGSSKGGSLTNNVLNRDVRIDNCMDVTFAGNHLEYGAQLHVTNCVMSICNNYFERGNQPSVLFDENDPEHDPENGNMAEANFKFSVINMTNNSFIVWFKKTADSAEVGRCSIKDLCDYDIAFCTNANAPYEVRMSQNYRYINLVDAASNDSSYHPSGILAGKLDPATSTVTALDDFNRYSHCLSTQATVQPKLRVLKHAVFDEIPAVTAKIYSNKAVVNMTYSDSKPSALPSSWQYRYYGQVVIDPARDICGPRFEITRGDFDPRYGNIINIGQQDSGTSFILRITRMNEAKLTQQQVDVPVCGCKLIYDNYYSVNGHRWADSISLLTTDPHPATAVEFKNKNVVCAKGSLPTSNEGWVKRDIIINNGETSTAAMWYFDGTKWIAR